jgi:hypothetical protein
VIEESGERPDPGEAPDDERRRYYRLTGFGGEVLAQRSKGSTAWCAPRAGRAPSPRRSRARRGRDGLSEGTAPEGTRTRRRDLGAGLPGRSCGPTRASFGTSTATRWPAVFGTCAARGWRTRRLGSGSAVGPHPAGVALHRAQERSTMLTGTRTDPSAALHSRQRYYCCYPCWAAVNGLPSPPLDFFGPRYFAFYRLVASILSAHGGWWARAVWVVVTFVFLCFGRKRDWRGNIRGTDIDSPLHSPPSPPPHSPPFPLHPRPHRCSEYCVLCELAAISCPDSWAPSVSSSSWIFWFC